jgi:hypothetical protein
MPEANHPTFRDNPPVRPEQPECSTRLGRPKRSLVQVLWPAVRTWATICIVGCAVLLLCQCHRQASTPAPTPSPTPTATPSPTSTPIAQVTPTPTPVPQVSASPLPVPSASETPDAFGDGIRQLLQASEKGFIEMRGKLKRTENGSGPDPLFRMRKIYEGTFLFEGAALAELEEVYFTAGQQPAYNYHLYYQALSARASMEKYGDFRTNLNRVLEGYEHTFGDRYDAWANKDARKTAVLLSSQEGTGSPEIQVHVAFSSPQW